MSWVYCVSIKKLTAGHLIRIVNYPDTGKFKTPTLLCVDPLAATVLFARIHSPTDSHKLLQPTPQPAGPTYRKMSFPSSA